MSWAKSKRPRCSSPRASWLAEQMKGETKGENGYRRAYFAAQLARVDPPAIVSIAKEFKGGGPPAHSGSTWAFGWRTRIRLRLCGSGKRCMACGVAASTQSLRSCRWVMRRVHNGSSRDYS